MSYQLKNQQRTFPVLAPSSTDAVRVARNFLLSLLWPALSAAIYILRYPKSREVTGILVFCGYVGWVLTPTEGSDSHTYMQKILDYRAGFDGKIKEPLLRTVVEILNFFGFNEQWYFVFLGLIFGVGWTWCARLIFERVQPNARLGVVATIFLGAFFLYYPVFPAVNARYTAAMWIMLAATLLVLAGRWRLALTVAVCGASIHFGHIMFLGALGLLLLSRLARNFQVLMAYLFLAICYVLPDQFILSLGDTFAELVGGSLGHTVDRSVHFGERVVAGDFAGGGSTRAWFIVWFQAVLFFGLLISGHFLFFRQIFQRPQDALLQLWVLIVIMWALYFAMTAHPIAVSRLQRNTSGLLLMWHALYFLKFSRMRWVSLSVMAVPLVFFNVVAYRIWLHQISVAVFMPLPFGLIADWWPRVMEMLGFG